MTMNLIKPIIYIVDDDSEFCQSLSWLLESVDLEVKIFHNGPDFLAAYKPVPSGCILLDIRMPLMSGLELQEQLNSQQNSLPIIFMTGHGDIPMAIRAMKAGAFDFLVKPYSEQLLLEQIQKAIVQNQQAVLANKQQAILASRFELLTTREHETLELIVDGKLTKVIADKLGISPKTVELHRAHAMKKMRATTVAELVRFYLTLNANSNRRCL